MAKAHLKLVTPATVKRTVTPRRHRNGDLRTREYLWLAALLVVAGIRAMDTVMGTSTHDERTRHHECT
jgi:hypothetical protein